MFDASIYINKLAKIEINLLNKTEYITSEFGKQELEYLILTIDKSKNLYYQLYLCVIKKLFSFYVKKYYSSSTAKYIISKIEFFKDDANIYNFCLEDILINELCSSISSKDYLCLLEKFHEYFLNTEIIFDKDHFNIQSSKMNSKNSGSVYTPVHIAKDICQKTINKYPISENDNKHISILDFGSGTGRFYFSILEILNNITKLSTTDIILNNLYAIDADEIAINILRLKSLALIEECNNKKINTVFDHVICRNMLITSPLSLFDKSNNQFSFDKDFKSIIKAGGFDVVVSNPPYAILKVNKKKQNNLSYKKYYTELISKISSEINYFNNSKLYNYSKEGVLNYYKLSIEMIFNLAKNNANIGIICPTTLFTDCSSKKLREYLLLKNKIKEINYFPENAKFFDNVSQATVIFYATKSETTNSIDICNNGSNFSVNINDIKRNFVNLEIPPINEIGWNILNKISTFKKVKQHQSIRNRRGELDLTLFKNFITKTPTKYRLVRGNMISKDSKIIDKNNEYVIEDFVKNKSKDYLNNDFNQTRLICQQISNIDTLKRLNFTISKKEDIIANSCNYLTIKDHNFLTSLLQIMNSYILNWRFKISSGNNHINNYEIDELPIIDYRQHFKSKNDLDLNIEICKKYKLSNEETKYILKDYYSEDVLLSKLGMLENV